MFILNLKKGYRDFQRERHGFQLVPHESQQELLELWRNPLVWGREGVVAARDEEEVAKNGY